MEPHTSSLRDQVRDAAVAVSEDGSIQYSSIFVRTGAHHITVGIGSGTPQLVNVCNMPDAVLYRDGFIEGHSLLTQGYMQYLYANQTNFPMVLQSAIEIARVELGF